MLESITPDPFGGANETARLVEVERIVSRFRWAMAIVAVTLNVLSRGSFPQWRLASTALFVASCVVATVVLRRPLTYRGVVTLGVFVVGADVVVLTTSTMTDVGRVELGFWGAALLVAFEAAVRWYAVGGVGASMALSVSVGLGQWVRAQHLGLPFSPGAVAFRAAVLISVGLAAGVIVQILERARSALARRARHSEIVSKFALMAPELDEARAVEAVTRLLRDELGFERVVVSLYEPEEHRLRPAACAVSPPQSSSAAEVEEAIMRHEAWNRGVDVGERRSPAARAFATNRAVIARRSDGEPGFGTVLAGDDAQVKLAVPMRAGGRVLGVLEVASSNPDEFDTEDAMLLESMAGQVAQVLEHARLSEMRRETIAELERLGEMKDDFIAIASHELRTPITALRGFARALASPQLGPDQQQQAIEVINRQVDRLGQLVEDLLAASLIDSGSHTPSPEVVDVAGVVGEVVGEAAAHATGHDIRVHVGSEAALVVADREYLRRVLVNLVSNAVKYSPDGGVVDVAAGVVDGEAVISVTDHGLGIPAEYVPALFQKFQRVPRAGGPGGTGLGLYIVRGLVEAMGGSVGVESEPGCGSKFWVVVPLAPSTADRGHVTGPVPDPVRSTRPGDVGALSPARPDDLSPARPDGPTRPRRG